MASAGLTDTQRSFLEKYVARLSAAKAPTAPLTSFLDDLEQRCRAVLAGDPPEAGKIRASLAFVQEKAAAGDMLAAMKAGATLDQLLASQSGGGGKVPVGTVAFQRSRIMWLSTKAEMKAGLDRFRSAVASQAADDEDQAEIMTAVDLLIEDFAAFDGRLEDLLDEITQTPDGPERERLKVAARKAVSDYVAALGSPFFSQIDSNPFLPLNVAAKGQKSLSTISATLS